MGILLPVPVSRLMNTLEQHGHTAYAVGGCVRDSLLGRTPSDWDLCTSALPWQIRETFAGHRLLLAGEKHGTVALLEPEGVFEITTYRVDGSYADHRHPAAVRFVPELRQDLARRDFTVNAMAYHPREGVVDLFGGQRDLAQKCIRCVGEPEQRFAEDALRILRAVRFAAQLDFAVDPPTAAAAAALCGNLSRISAERIFAELSRLLAGPAAGRVLREYPLPLSGALPELLPCMGCVQPAFWHFGDVWEHTAAAVGALGPGAAPAVRWAVLLHDLAKPLCRIQDAEGAPHFYGHNQRGAVLARQILRRLHAPRALEDRVVELVGVHDCALPGTDPEILQLLAGSGPEFLEQLCAVKYADLAAHAPLPAVQERRAAVEQFEARMRVLAAERCYRLKDLAVSGVELLAAGVAPGPEIGVCLQRLLNAVMAGELPNEKRALLAALPRAKAGEPLSPPKS